MGLKELFTGNKGVAAREPDSRNGMDETEGIRPTENTEQDKEGEATVVNSNKKKRYLYIAFNDAYGVHEVIVDEKGEPFFATVEEGSSPNWREDIRKYADKIIVDKNYRMELEEIPAEVTGKDRDKRKKEIRKDAQEALMRMLSKEIREAREKQGRKTEAKRDGLEKIEPANDTKAASGQSSMKAGEEKAAENARHEENAAEGAKPEEQAVEDAQPEEKGMENMQSKEKATEDAQPEDKAMENAQPEEKATEDARPDKKAVEDAKPGEKAVEDAKPGEKAVEDAKPEEKAVKDAKPEEKAMENAQPEKKATENVQPEGKAGIDPAAVMKAVESVGTQISRDIADSVDDLLSTIADNDKELLTDIKSSVEAQARNSDSKARKYFEQTIDSIGSIGQKIQKASEDTARRMNDSGRSINDSQDKLNMRMNAVGKRMGELVESVESIEGDLHRLDQLDEIAGLLRNKGLNISLEIPPVNAEEEDIVNLVRYSQKITEQLGYAARDLIRKQESFKSQAESNENEQRMMEQKIDKAYRDGVDEGRKQVVRQLLAKYEDIDAIKDSADNYVHVVWTLLTELGVVIDGEGYYEKGREIELSGEEIEKMMASYSKLEGPGKYRVARTGLSLYGEIISPAQFEKIAGNETAKESEEPEGKEDSNGIKEQ